jgi:hypothetical protein
MYRWKRQALYWSPTEALPLRAELHNVCVQYTSTADRRYIRKCKHTHTLSRSLSRWEQAVSAAQNIGSISRNNPNLNWGRSGILVLTRRNIHSLHSLSPPANYTDRATAACRRSDCQHFADRGYHVVSVTDPYGRILGFLDRSRYFSIK